jgi:hypothetical protein
VDFDRIPVIVLARAFRASVMPPRALPNLWTIYLSGGGEHGAMSSRIA